jgi:hypothetical protein
MCHHGRIRLSAEDREDVRKLSGIMVPIYATPMVALLRCLRLPWRRCLDEHDNGGFPQVFLPPWPVLASLP